MMYATFVGGGLGVRAFYSRFVVFGMLWGLVIGLDSFHVSLSLLLFALAIGYLHVAIIFFVFCYVVGVDFGGYFSRYLFCSFLILFLRSEEHTSELQSRFDL